MKLLLVAAVAAALGVGSGWLLFTALDEGTPEPAASPWNTCTNPIQGFSIDYPAGWHTDHRAPELACFNFDPRPFQAPREGKITTAIQVAIEQAPTDPGSDPVKFERVEDGMNIYGYRVPAEGGREFSVYATNNAGVDFDSWKTIVDKAVGTMRFATPIAAPEVDGARIPPSQPGLPEPVARKRAEIWTAAKGGDYAEVARLVDPEGFEYTFGGAVPGGPAAYWRRLDQTTKERPLETLAAILELPYAFERRSRLYVWPFAFARRAASLAPQEKAQLADALGEETVKVYEQLGSYLGYRAGIDEQGAWVFYVAGD